MKERLSKEHLGAATRRERGREEEDADVGRPVRPRPDPCKLMATDLASGRVKIPLRDILQWNLAPGRVLRSFFEPADQMVEGALRLVDHMLTRQPEPQVRVDRRATPGAGRAEPEVVAQALELIRASDAGQPLSAELAMLLADQLGADLTGVRVHTDDAADRAAVAIGAEAFTVGDHLYFARGRYQPHTVAGLRLIAHEAVHAVQQRSARFQGHLAASMPTDASEVDADEFADDFVAIMGKYLLRGDEAAKAARSAAEPRVGGEATKPATSSAVSSTPWSRDELDLLLGGTHEDGNVPQRDADATSPEAVHMAAARGIATPSQPLPYQGQLEKSFGVSLSDVKAHVGGRAEDSAKTMGAEAYATGDHVVLPSSPSLATTAHEVAHVIQQRQGIQLPGGVGEVGDAYERAADAAAAAVVRGESVRHVGSAATASATKSGAVQQSKGQPSGTSGAGPAHAAPLPARSQASGAPLLATPDTLIFPATLIGQESAPQSTTLTNAGAEPVRIEDVTEVPARVGSPFIAYVANGGALEPNETTDVQVAFRPKRAGQHGAELHVLTDGGASSAHIAVRGVAHAGASHTSVLHASPRTLTLSAAVGDESAPATVRIENRGAAPTRIDQLEFASGDKSPYRAYGENAGELQPGETLEFAVGFRPKRQGHQHDTLRVITEDGAVAARIALRGRGLSAAQARMEDRVNAAKKGAAALPLRTYQDMLDAMKAAAALVKTADLAEAELVATGVVERLSELTTAKRLHAIKEGHGYNGLTKDRIDELRLRVESAATSMRRFSSIGGTFDPNTFVRDFESSRPLLILLTGEETDSRYFERYDRATDKSLAIGAAGYAAILGVPLLIGLSAEVGSMVVYEAGILSEFGGKALTELHIWALRNPLTARAIMASAVGLGLDIVDQGPEQFFANLETKEGLVFLILQIVSDSAQIQGAQYDDEAAGHIMPHGGAGLDAPPRTSRATGSSSTNPGDSVSASSPATHATPLHSDTSVSVGRGRKRTLRDVLPERPSPQADAATVKSAVSRVRALVAEVKRHRNAGQESSGPTHGPRVVVAGHDADLATAAARLKPKPGYLDVVIHGEDDNFSVQMQNGWERLDHRGLARLIKKSGNKFKRIRLVSCEAGRDPRGPAQHLANKLGVRVDAPTDLAGIRGDGSIVIGPDEYMPTGGWEPFWPRKSESRFQKIPDDPPQRAIDRYKAKKAKIKEEEGT